MLNRIEDILMVSNSAWFENGDQPLLRNLPRLSVEIDQMYLPMHGAGGFVHTERWHLGPSGSSGLGGAGGREGWQDKANRWFALAVLQVIVCTLFSGTENGKGRFARGAKNIRFPGCFVSLKRIRHTCREVRYAVLRRDK